MLATNPHEYWWVSWGRNPRLVCIKPGKQGWDIYLDDDILIQDGFSSPELAALCASKNDFSDSRASELFSGVSVTSDLNAWRTARPKTPFVFPNHNN